MRKEYFKEIGGYAGVAWKGGKWQRFDCETCGILFGHLERGPRRQGPPTDKQWESYQGKTTLFWHDPKRHGK